MNESWIEIVSKALRDHKTPFYIISEKKLQEALDELNLMRLPRHLRHWLSLKTQPVAAVLRWWYQNGGGIEVVSEYEFLAARKEKVDCDKILINGTAKHTWLLRYNEKGLYVNFDSLAETQHLLPRAKSCGWHIGIRIHPSVEYDPDEPSFGGQFGMTKEELSQSINMVKRAGLSIECVHFHMKTDNRDPESFRRAIKETGSICQELNIRPRYIDCGGGFSVPGEYPVSSSDIETPSIREYQSALHEVDAAFPEAEEIWLENGRFITARACALVITIHDVKDRKDSRYLICDGGRVNHAFPSDWEMHDLDVLPERLGDTVLTTVCGPNCMSYDKLCRCMLPHTIVKGDSIVWNNAGAYHIPWETRFSRGLAEVIWCNLNGELSTVRNHEEFDSWWSCWQ